MLNQLSLTTNRRLWATGLLACCTILMTSGCGPDHKSRGVVKGKVTIGTKALTTGTVMFVNKDGISGSASIDLNGNYEMPDAPLGDCKVTVTVQAPPDFMMRPPRRGEPAVPDGPKMPDSKDSGSAEPTAPGATAPKVVVPIDGKYSNPETSGLSFTVKKGEQTYNIEL